LGPEYGGFIDQSNFWARIFSRTVCKALGRDRHFTPHGLRHTFASLHLSRGTNLLWVQQQGGWTSPSVLLTTYTHFLPTELGGYADALAALYGTKPRQPRDKQRDEFPNPEQRRALP
jgi:integrase